jgi:ABC-type transporter MlaC component
VQPTDQQHLLLDQLKDATANALNLLQSTCATDLPSTPTGRLAAMRQRVASMLQAVQIVRPSLDKFYQSLSDEQKERFISLDAQGNPKQGNPKSVRTANRQQPNLAQACGGSSNQITSLPINQIRQVLHPNDAQQAALDEVNNAIARAANLLKENCDQEAQDQPITPPARLVAMEARLNALLKAIDTVQPAMAKFYNSLTDEQKARFDRLGPRQA